MITNKGIAMIETSLYTESSASKKQIEGRAVIHLIVKLIEFGLTCNIIMQAINNPIKISSMEPAGVPLLFGFK